MSHIDLLAVVNTEILFLKCTPDPEANLSGDMNNPTDVTNSTGTTFLFCRGALNVTGNGTSNILIDARQEQTFTVRATTLSDNFDCAVLLYNVKAVSPSEMPGVVVNVFDAFNLDVSDMASAPVPAEHPVAPNFAIFGTRQLADLSSTIIAPGVETFAIQLAVFTRQGASNASVLRGFCQVTSKITVS